MSLSISPSSELLLGRRALEGIQGVKLTQDLSWQHDVKMWLLRCQLTPAIQENEYIPQTTNWYVLIESTYPWGDIKFFPAKEGGISFTFPHQSYNTESDKIHWRTGNLCLGTDVHSLGRQGYHLEPYDPAKRLRWYFLRAIEWLKLASQSKLVESGDVYELPQFPRLLDQPTIAFWEDSDYLDIWNSQSPQIGFVEFAELNQSMWFVKRVLSVDGNPILVPNWGIRLSEKSKVIAHGLWMRFNEIPVLPIWKAPKTWGELRLVSEKQGISLDSELKRVVDRFRDGKVHPFLIGFPIPEKVGEPFCQLHWQALFLPTLSYGNLTAKGFRPKKGGYWLRDRSALLSDTTELRWLKSENWHKNQISTRGSLPVSFTTKHILIVGVGAVGSVVAELLVRAGAHQLWLMDCDKLEAGNLVRHILEMEALGFPKAQGVAERLNSLSPHATVQFVNGNFPSIEKFEIARVRSCDLIIDCTGDDKVLRDLATFTWGEDQRTFVSISIGLKAKRLYCFNAQNSHFPDKDFRTLITPWLARDIEDHKNIELPREGIGCWHPVFPARADDIWMLASIAVKHLEALSSSPVSHSILSVFEQYFENEIFIGVRKVNGEVK
jgi:hypothetical protein